MPSEVADRSARNEMGRLHCSMAPARTELTAWDMAIMTDDAMNKGVAARGFRTLADAAIFHRAADGPGSSAASELSARPTNLDMSDTRSWAAASSVGSCTSSVSTVTTAVIAALKAEGIVGGASQQIPPAPHPAPPAPAVDLPVCGYCSKRCGGTCSGAKHAFGLWRADRKAAVASKKAKEDALAAAGDGDG
uniref:Uncharacterized protein n=1 Tax=Coccolithus braarudii TaxID=221442 RepID=A0A7S0PUA7_9EUKA|mmetsp:Transcript_1233/g.2573  ORF Transcript_1233/g.2573 Transcript_1233/m.2573 type:complete len:192 (+) Transcript_1233:357-932(+)